MKDVAGRRHRRLRLPGRNRRHLRGRARGPQRADRRAPGQPVSFLPFAHALVARQDLPIPAWLFAWGASIVLIVSFFALSAAWRKPRFEEAALAPARGGALRAPCSAWPVQALCGADRRLPARRRDLLRPARHRSARSQLRPHLPLRHRLARLPLLLGPARRHLPALQPLAGGRPRRGRRLPGDRRPAPRPPRLPGARSAAGRPRSACSPSSGWRSSTAPAAASPSASTRTRPPSPPSSTAPTRWR